jgi:Protein of unknown function (DUF2934)
MARKSQKTAVSPHNNVDHPESLHTQIAALAHSLWQERGCPEGTPEADWFTAEQQIAERKTEIIKVVRRARRVEASV